MGTQVPDEGSFVECEGIGGSTWKIGGERDVEK